MFPLYVAIASIVLFAATVGCYELGRKLGSSRPGKDTGSGVIDGAVFALLGLLVAFTFSGAAARYDSRKQLIIDETNAIGTAYRRLDLLPAAAQPDLRAAFREYVDARLAVYDALPDLGAARLELVRSKHVEDAIWHQAVTATTSGPAPAEMLMMPALNQMFDIANTRTLVTEIHPPTMIFVMLAALILVGALFAGDSMAAHPHSWLHVLGLAATLAITVYVILDLEYPRLGMFRVSAFDHALRELRQAMR